jgi:hypothetical protein
MLLPFFWACSQAYYGAMEKVGIHKRDILVDRVESARNSQAEAQEQFKSALEQFGAVVQLKNTDLKKAYEKLNAEYENCEKAANNVSSRINKVESVADALFKEWEEELLLYQNPELRKSSKQKLEATRSRYAKMLVSMHRAEKSMTPVLRIFHDNVLFLKHNLNAQAIGALQSEFSVLQGRIEGLIKKMHEAIASSDKFIADLRQ